MRVAFLTNAPAPYRLSFYASWARLDELLVVYDQMSSDRAWTLELQQHQFRFECLGSAHLSLTRTRKDLQFDEKRSLYFSTGVWRLLRRVRPQAVVSAEFGVRTLLAALYCRFHGVPLAIVNEGTLHTESLVGPIRLLLRRVLVRAASQFWSNGRDSTNLLKSYGVRGELIEEGMTGVDTHFFVQQARDRWSCRAAIREKLGLKGTVFLVLGSLSGRKGTPQLRDAVDQLCQLGFGSGFSLLFLGSGDEEEATRAWARCLPTGVVTAFTGFVQMDSVPDYLAAADWGLIPTLEDCWPLATLEMLLAGLPQLFSRYNGGTAELCEDGVTGYAFDPIDPTHFARAIARAIDHPLRRLDGTIIDRYAAFYSPEAQARRASLSIRRFAEKTPAFRNVP